ncbi:MAG: helicase C-terminal domain-containing protein [Promethearchaeota archaeon]
MKPSDVFPYEKYRTKQEELIDGLHDNLKRGKNCVVVAPNGFGKTVTALAAILPVVLDMELDLKVVYCCRTHSQNARVIQELQAIQEHLSSGGKPGSGSTFSGVSIRGRGEMCLDKRLLEMRSSPRDRMNACQQLRKNKLCKFYLNLYRKKKDVEKFVRELSSKSVDAQKLIEYCETFDYCPYFLVRNFLLQEAKVIACNYQWVFNPSIRENFLKFIDGDLSKVLLVMDECHNLLNVATELDSDRTGIPTINGAINECREYQAPAEVLKFLKATANLIRDYERKGVPETRVDPSEVLELIHEDVGSSAPIQEVVYDLQEFGKSVQEEKADLGLPPSSYCHRTGEFWQKWIQTRKKPNYIHLAVVKRGRRGRKLSFLETVALDPRNLTKELFDQTFATMSISGTVIPDHFARLTGMKELDKAMQAYLVKSPFPRENLAAFIVQGVSTKGNSRNARMYGKILGHIEEALPEIPGNVGIFCASYLVLRGLRDAGLDEVVEATGKKLFLEKQGMTASENATMVGKFKAEGKGDGAVLAGVCGGRNSEGEDFPGDAMNAVFVVGIPYSRPTPRVEAKIKYFDEIFDGKGWLYAYQIPAFQRANQACGRPIRRITDRGAIVLLDERYAQRIQWLSSWIRPALEVLPEGRGNLKWVLREFFSRGAET